MKSVGNFFARLSSRKFILTVAGIVGVTLFPEASSQIVALIVAFVGAEGAADAVSRYAVTQAASRQEKSLEQQRIIANAFGEDDDDSSVDTSTVVSGDYPL